MDRQCHLGLPSATWPPLGPAGETVCPSAPASEAVTFNGSGAAIPMPILCLKRFSALLNSSSKLCHEKGCKKWSNREYSRPPVLIRSFHTPSSGISAKTCWNSSLMERVMRSPSLSLYCRRRSFSSARLGKTLISCSLS